ncbi:Inner membrane transport protein YnfM [Baekduia alba]|uniref:MFS transporter n=1 Tax=Baekduia alba TaxID=2997333 RepID=UPI0023409731|nr:MFS transporter [Baekduia alba]WCB96252.1 Inner membrane transport protein YnfM [Baekduia alba]
MDHHPGYVSGDPGFRRLAAALFAAGLGTFALLYSTQALLPVLSRDFDVSPGISALSLAVTTASVGIGLLPAAWLSDAIGRTRVMGLSLVLSSALGLTSALAPTFAALLAVRGLEGLALAGLPAVAMAYLAEEVHPRALGGAVGLYIGGNAIGGMVGRLLAGGLADVGGWRAAVAGVGALGVVCAIVVLRLLPASRNFRPRRVTSTREALGRLRAPLADPGLLRLNAMGALLMGTFVAVYNGLGFRLAAEPFDLSPAALALVFLVYPIGSASSAHAGRLADRVGRRTVLPLGVLLTGGGLALTATASLPLIVVGIATLTAGFFAGHSVASSWVGRRAAGAAGQASALYLLAYYAGSSIAGPLAGTAWTMDHWNGVLAIAGVMLAVALLVSLRLRRTPPLGAPLVPAG